MIKELQEFTEAQKTISKYNSIFVDMVKACDHCLIIWDGKSKGTKHDIDLCTQYKKPYTINFYK